MTDDEIVESIKAICAPLPECQALRDKIIIALENRFKQEHLACPLHMFDFKEPA